MMMTAICRSSAAIDPASVKFYRAVGYKGSSAAFMGPLGTSLYSPGGDLREEWVVGHREILEFKPGFGPMGPLDEVAGVCVREPTPKEVPVAFYPITVTQTMAGNMPQVGENPIDWSKFLPTGNLRTGISTLKAGEVWAYGTTTSQLVFSVNSVGPRGSAIEVLARSVECSWCLGPEGMASAPSNSMLIRHADGTWAPGYGPDGPVSKPAATGAIAAAEKLLSDFAARTRPTFVHWGVDHSLPVDQSPPPVLVLDLGMPPVKPRGAIRYGFSVKRSFETAELAIENSVVAKLPDAPRADSHRSLEDMKPRWKTPAYSPPGRWRK